MRKVTPESDLVYDTASTVERDNLANTGREALSTTQFHHSQVDLPDE